MVFEARNSPILQLELFTLLFPPLLLYTLDPGLCVKS